MSNKLLKKALVQHASLSGHDPGAVVSQSTCPPSPPHPPHASDPSTSTQQPLPSSQAPKSLPQPPLGSAAPTVKPPSGFKRVIRRLRPAWLTRRIGRERHTTSAMPGAETSVVGMPTIAIIPPSAEAIPATPEEPSQARPSQMHTEAQKPFHRLLPSWTKRGGRVDEDESRGRSRPEKVLVGTLRFGTDLPEGSRSEVISVPNPVVVSVHEEVISEVEVYPHDDVSVEAAQHGHEPPLDELDRSGVATTNEGDHDTEELSQAVNQLLGISETDASAINPTEDDYAPAERQVPLLKAITVDGLDAIPDLDISAQPPPRPPRSPARQLFKFPPSPQTQSPANGPTDGANALGLDVNEEVASPRAEWTENGLKVRDYAHIEPNLWKMNPPVMRKQIPPPDLSHSNDSITEFDADISAAPTPTWARAGDEGQEQDGTVAADEAVMEEPPVPPVAIAETSMAPGRLVTALFGSNDPEVVLASDEVGTEGVCGSTNAEKKKRRRKAKSEAKGNSSIVAQEQNVATNEDAKKLKKKSRKVKGKKTIDVERLTPEPDRGSTSGAATSPLDIALSSGSCDLPIDPVQYTVAPEGNVVTTSPQVAAPDNFAEIEVHSSDSLSDAEQHPAAPHLDGIRTFPDLATLLTVEEGTAHLDEVLSRQPVAAIPIDYPPNSPVPSIRSRSLVTPAGPLLHVIDTRGQGRTGEHEDGRVHSEWPAQEGQEAGGSRWPRMLDSPLAIPKPSPHIHRPLRVTDLLHLPKAVPFLPQQAGEPNHDGDVPRDAPERPREYNVARPGEVQPPAASFVPNILDLNLGKKVGYDEQDSLPPSPLDMMDPTFNGIWKPFNHDSIIKLQDPRMIMDPFALLVGPQQIDVTKLRYPGYRDYLLRLSFQDHPWQLHYPRQDVRYSLLTVFSQDHFGCIVRAAEDVRSDDIPPGLSPPSPRVNIRVTRKAASHASTFTLASLRREVSILKATTERRLFTSFVMPMLRMWEDDLNVYQVYPSYVCDLAQWMRICPLEVFPVYLYTAELTLALRSLHAEGIVHGSIQMEHVYVTADGHLLLGGLGSACRKDAKCQGWPQEDGYLPYRAPETFKRDVAVAPPTTAEDVYALGILFVELHDGHRAERPVLPPRGTPAWREFERERARMDVVRDLPHVRVLIGRYPELWDLLLHMLDLNPGKRWPMTRLMEHPYFELLDLAKVRSRAPDFDLEEPFIRHGCPDDYARYFPREAIVGLADLADQHIFTSDGRVTLPAATFRHMLAAAREPVGRWLYDHPEACQWWKSYVGLMAQNLQTVA